MSLRRILILGLVIAAAAGAIGFLFREPIADWARVDTKIHSIDSPAEGSVVQATAGSQRIVVRGTAGFLSRVVFACAVHAPDIECREEEMLKHRATPAFGKFSFDLPVSPGRNAIFLRSEGRAVVRASPVRFGVGEVFVVAGQSNAAGSSKTLFLASSPDVRLRMVGERGNLQWRRGDDPQIPGGGGSCWPRVGDQLVQRCQRPVAFLNVAVGGTGIREWDRDGPLVRRLISALEGTRPHLVRAILWQQGESDGGLPSEDYARHLTGLIRRVDKQLGGGRKIPWVVATASYAGGSARPAVREGQAAVCRAGLALPGPDIDVLDQPFREADRVHLNGEGCIRAADLWVESLLGHFYRQEAPTSPQGREPAGRK